MSYIILKITEHEKPALMPWGKFVSEADADTFLINKLGDRYASDRRLFQVTFLESF